MAIDVNSEGLKAKDEMATWVTWLAKLLADPSECPLPAYIQTRYHVSKEDVYTGDWAQQHSATIERVKSRLAAAGRSCFIEREVAVTSRTGIKIAGAIDVWAPETRGEASVAIDAKTGKHKPAHRLQVNLYQVMSFASPDFECTSKPAGMLVYPEKEVWIRPEEASAELVGRLAHAMEIIADDTQPEPTPSKSNCRYCSIGHLCPDRAGNAKAPAPTMELF